MTMAVTIRETFDDARRLYDSAMERLDAGDIRDAAEKAWCAARRATEALVLAHPLPPSFPRRRESGPGAGNSGATVNNTIQVSAGLRQLALQDEAFNTLPPKLAERARYLHNDCFYNGHCEPLESTARLIRETIHYIQDAEALAGP